MNISIRPIRTCLPREGLENLPANARLLIIRLRSMGDTILLTPSLRMLHEWRPDLKVSLLLDRPWAELLAGNPDVEQIIVAGSKISTILRVRRERFDAVINLHGGPSSAQITRFSGAGLRAGMAQFRSRGSYNLIVPRTQDIFSGGQIKGGHTAFHTAEHAALVFGWLGMPLRTIPPAQLFPASAARESVLRKLAPHSGGPARYAVIHPAALYASKRWSARGFAEIASHLAERHGLQPIFLGAQEDEASVREVERAQGKTLVRALGWPIGEMLALIAGAQLFLGNDSGPAHAAAALGVPVAVIFGSSSSVLWGPWRAAASAIIQNQFACNPCPGDRCHAFGEPRCILSIETEQVRRTVDKLLTPKSE